MWITITLKCLLQYTKWPKSLHLCKRKKKKKKRVSLDMSKNIQVNLIEIKLHMVYIKYILV